MSYCRWSDNWGDCDVYVYEDVSGGWTTHVAGRRLKRSVPQEIRDMVPPITDPGWAGKWMLARSAEQEWRKQFPHEMVSTKLSSGEEGSGMLCPADSEYIDLSEIGDEAGESFSDPEPGDCANRLEALREKGFLVPQYAIDELREEQAEADAA